ncbi:MAG: S-adenosylmethionine:tRNA ribosyltransferase-isomerase [Myxococcota bacterium]
MRTEDRPAPPELRVGEVLALAGTTARVEAVSARSARLVTLVFEAPDVWSALYAHGRPVQYSYLGASLGLAAFQTPYATRPWAAEMPSAGRPLGAETLLALRRRGVGVATLTHAAGLSATGDAALDAALPLPERYDVPAATVAAIARVRAAGGRAVAVGTTVVRALEGRRGPAVACWGPGPARRTWSSTAASSRPRSTVC